MRPAFAILPLILALGCATPEREQIPTYPLMEAGATLDAIRARSAGIESVSGEGAITLTDPKNDSVRLDAAFVFAPPDRARVRAWKFGQAVLDLTVTPDGTWLFLPRGRDGHADQFTSASQQTGQAVRQWLRLLSGEFGGAGDATKTEVSDGRLIVSQFVSGQRSVRCEIDRATLTPRRFTLFSPDGAERFGLTLGQYQTVGPTVWPRRIEATSATGRILIETRDPELNAAPPGAFEPPARAVKVP